MKKIIKSRLFAIIVVFCLIVSTVLLVFNLSQFQKFQINRRNRDRKSQIDSILSGVKRYISANNNLPTTSNPDTKSFLPELLFDGSNPYGGVSVSTLENMQEYFDLSIKDPSGDPYLIGTYEDQVVTYTGLFERFQAGNTVYYNLFKVNSSVDGKVTTD